MDAFGNIGSILEPDPSQTNTNGQATTLYTYDALNHLTQVSMPRQMPGGNTVTQTRTFNYLNGSTIGAYLRSTTNPENATVSFTYNADGTMATKTDAKYQQLSYTYDALGRVQQVSQAGTGALRTYYYDSNPFIPGYSQNAAGRLTAIQYNSFPNQDTVLEMYNYTAPGAVSGKRLRLSRPYAGNQTATGDLIASFGRDAEGRLNSMSYPAGGPAYTYAYDAMGRLSQMNDQSNNVLVNNLQYGPAGQLQQIGFFGATETRQYNSMLQLTQWTVTNGGMGTVLNMQYGYSATQNNGKIAMQNDLLGGEQVNYVYDSLNRLISAITTGQTWGQGYNYDPFGNLTAKIVLYGSVPTMSVGVDAATNRLIGQSYDANGNNLSAASYDAENRVYAAGGGFYLYGYDSGNKRIWAKTPSGESYFLYGPDGRQLGKYTPAVVDDTFLTFTSSSI